MKQTLFLDTNVILDLLGKREPFFDEIAKIATLAEQQKLILYASTLSFSTTDYILRKYENPKTSIEKLRKFKVICKISTSDEQTVEKTLNSDFSDFEDALQYYSAIDTGCDIIITRNQKDFKSSAIPVLTADEFLKTLQEKI